MATAPASRHRMDRRVIIRMEGVDKWYRQLPGADRHRPAGRKRRAHRHLRPVGLGQVDADPLHQPARDSHQKGRIVVDGIELAAGGKNVDAVRREVGMVFQQFNLFPHLTVLQNCTLAPMKVARHVPRTRPRRRR